MMSECSTPNQKERNEMRRKIAIYFDDDSTVEEYVPQSARSLFSLCETQAPFMVDNVIVLWEDEEQWDTMTR